MKFISADLSTLWHGHMWCNVRTQSHN